jgi:hypothetical protein
LLSLDVSIFGWLDATFDKHEQTSNPGLQAGGVAAYGYSTEIGLVARLRMITTTDTLTRLLQRFETVVA